MKRTLLFILVCVAGSTAHHFYPSLAIGLAIALLADKICIHDYRMIKDDITVLDNEGVGTYFMDGCHKCGKVRFEKYSQLEEG